MVGKPGSARLNPAPSSDGIEQGFSSSGDGKAVREKPVGKSSPLPSSL
jgi:hypothetical protein